MEMRVELHRIVDLLPEADDLTMIRDLQHRLALLAKIARADAAAEAGHVLTTDEARQRLLGRVPA